MDERERIEELEAELTASRKVIDALVRRAERQLDTGPDHFAVIKALSNMESIIEQRSRELYVSEARYRALYDHSPDMLFTVDERGRITAVNLTCLESFSCEENALIGCRLSSLFDPRGQEEVERWAASGFTELAEPELRLDDGRIVSLNAAPIQGFSGEVQVVLRDVTTRRNLEVELGHARRLAAIGHLAAAVAHEINNPLTVMQLRLELLETVPLDEAVAGPLRVLGEHTHRIARIVRNLQSFAHPRSERRERVPLAEVLCAAREVAAPTLAQVTVVGDVPQHLAVHGDRGRLEQVLVNLLTNAAEAQPEGGHIYVTAFHHGDRVFLRVDDEGPGIPEELLDHIFTPFVSGRPDRGSGLGLAIAWSIVKEHGGTIHCANCPNGGARFEVVLPRALEVEVEAERDPTPLAPERRLRLLVIDDEPALLELIQSFAREVGHDVVGVPSAEAALRLLATDDRFDALLSDIRLPGMSGRDLLRLLRQDRPALARRTILMSGFFHRPGPGTPYLQKPFGRMDLLEVLVQVAEPG